MHQAVEALAFVAEPVLVGNEDVVEEQLGVDECTLPHLLHRLARAEPGPSLRIMNAVTPLERWLGLSWRRRRRTPQTHRW